MSRLIFITSFQLFNLLCFAQTPTFVWNKQYNGYVFPSSITTDEQKNVIVIGLFSQVVDFDFGVNDQTLTANNFGSIFIQKLDSSGNLVWVKQIDYSSQYFSGNFFSDIETDQNGDIYFCSEYKGTVDFDPNVGSYQLTTPVDLISGMHKKSVFLCKLSMNGDFLWVKTLDLGENIERRLELFIDDSNSVYLTGDFGNESSDLDPSPNVQICNPYNYPANTNFILKLNSQGNFIFANTSPVHSLPYDFVFEHTAFVDNNGSIFFSGSVESTIDIDMGQGVLNVSPEGNSDGIIVKYNQVGQVDWYKKINSLSGSYCKVENITKSQDNYLYVNGIFQGGVDFDPSSSNYYLTSSGHAFFCAKYTENGDLIWVRNLTNLDELGGFELQKVQAINNGGVVISFTASGYFPFDVDPGIGTIMYSSENDSYGVLLILDQNGNYQWSKQYNYDNEEVVIFDMFVTPQNDILFSGEFGGFVNFDPSNTSPPMVSTSTSGFLTKYKLSSVVGAFENVIDTFSIYPNPSNDFLIIDNGNNSIMNGYNISIISSTGQEVYYNQLNQQILKVDLSTWNENGLYHLYILDSKGTIIKHRKIIITINHY